MARPSQDLAGDGDNTASSRDTSEEVKAEGGARLRGMAFDSGKHGVGEVKESMGPKPADGDGSGGGT